MNRSLDIRDWFSELEVTLVYQPVYGAPAVLQCCAVLCGVSLLAPVLALSFFFFLSSSSSFNGRLFE